MDLASKQFLIRVSDSKTTAVGVHIGDRFEHFPDDQAYVIQTVKITENLETDDLNVEIENDVDEIMQLAASELRHKLPAIRAEIQEMLGKYVIVPSKNPCSSPMVMAPKKDGTNRMCIDYRKVNEFTPKDAYPLPRIGQRIDKLQGAGFFSSLDLASGYWQVPVAQEDQHKTAFCTPDGGLFEFSKMPFGLTNAPATFERLMNNTFAADLIQHVLIFLDNVLLYSKL